MKTLIDKVFQDGIETGIIKSLKIIRQYKIDIFNDEHILAFTAVCEVEEKLQKLLHEEN